MGLGMITNISSKWPAHVRVGVLLALTALGLMGNYFKYPIFLNIDFLFGSVFAMLALQVFGLGGGVAVGVIAAVVTYFLWNHPYAIVIMTLEVVAVGLLMRHRKIGMVLADAIYWSLRGARPRSRPSALQCVATPPAKFLERPCPRRRQILRLRVVCAWSHAPAWPLA